MMRPSDEQLMAYVDGELPPAEAAAIAALAQSDADVARRLRAFTATRALLQQSFAQAEIAPRTLQFLRAADIAPPRRRQRWVPMALAASLVAGISALLLPRLFPDDPGAAGAALPAELQAMLERTPSGEPVNGTIDGRAVELLPLASLQTGAGGYCREYAINALDGPASTPALACRDANGRWTAMTAPHAADPAQAGGSYRLAGAQPASIDARRLSMEEEQAAIAADWGRGDAH